MALNSKNAFIQVPPQHYYEYERGYDSKSRFISYWHQINEVLRLRERKLLEVGIGNGTVSSYLDKRIHVTTIDVDKELNPNVVGTVTFLPFKNNSFDIVLIAEVLEHLHYNKALLALKEINRITKRWAILTLPHVGINFTIKLRFPRSVFMRNVKIGIPFKNKNLLKIINSLFRANLSDKFRFKVEGICQHYWEIGRKNYGFKKVYKDIEKSGFDILRSFTPEEVMDHRFFILKKRT